MKFDPNEADEYQCHLELHYKLCVPQRRLTKIIHSQWVPVGRASGASTPQTSAANFGKGEVSGQRIVSLLY